MAMPTSTANWHWKNKNCTAWARGWFERELPALGAEDGVRVLRVDDVDGDVELGQRKSKCAARRGMRAARLG
jgi:activator of HSP90 ATPase